MTDPRLDSLLAAIKEGFAMTREHLALLSRLTELAERMSTEPAVIERPAQQLEHELTDCERDIIEVLRTVGARITCEELMRALQLSGKRYSDRTVYRALGKLKEKGIVNSRHSKPYGYALNDRGE